MKEFNRVFKLVVSMGEILISCDAETLRVIDTMDIVAKSFGIDEFDSFIITNGLFVTATCDGITLAKNKQIRSHTSNIGKIESINALSRNIADGNVSLYEAEKILEQIKVQHIWSPFMRYIGAIIGCSTLTILYGGTYLDGIITAAITICSHTLLEYLNKKKVNGVLINLIVSIIITILAILSKSLSLCNFIDKVIIGSIMPLVPGILLTNGIRDITNNDYLSGIIRVIEAMLIASSIAIGVGFVFNFIKL